MWVKPVFSPNSSCVKCIKNRSAFLQYVAFFGLAISPLWHYLRRNTHGSISCVDLYSISFVCLFCKTDVLVCSCTLLCTLLWPTFEAKHYQVCLGRFWWDWHGILAGWSQTQCEIGVRKGCKKWKHQTASIRDRSVRLKCPNLLRCDHAGSQNPRLSTSKTPSH